MLIIKLSVNNLQTKIKTQVDNLNYKEVDDPSLTVQFALDDEPNTSLLIWTTTPWTLAANVAAAVGTDLVYVKVQQGADGTGQDNWTPSFLLSAASTNGTVIKASAGAVGFIYAVNLNAAVRYLKPHFLSTVVQVLCRGGLFDERHQDRAGE